MERSESTTKNNGSSDPNVLNLHLEQYENHEDTQYYDWNKTLSYDADVTMVVGARGVGKTYGLRKQCIRDYLKHEWRFVEICRNKNQVSPVSAGYFDRIISNEEFPEYVFKTTPQKAYIAKRKDDEDDKKKIVWHCIGYFVALTDAQLLKRTTFTNVRRIIFDEAIMDKRDRYHRYVNNEYSVLVNIIDTVSRERADTESLAPRVYLLGNALDMFNPYFEAYGINSKPPRGYSWYKNKTMLLDYLDSKKYSQEKLTGTVAGRMIAGTVEGEIEANNEFMNSGIEFVMKKTPKAKFSFGISYDNRDYAVWIDMFEGYYFITKKFPKNTEGKPIFTITASDAKINYIMAKRADKPIQMLSDAFYMGIMRFDNMATMNGFLDLLTMFGIRR